MKSRAELLQTFQQLATRVAERPIELTSEAMAISALGIDSLGMLEIIGEMERELSIRIPDDQLVGINTVGQLVDLVERRLGAG
ncbi:MAG: acyl carrier protein [Myxococcales bacterium]|nr:acyl carrier protein [Myxococcales bacterium]